MKSVSLVLLLALATGTAIPAQERAGAGEAELVTLRALQAEVERVHPSLRAAEQSIQAKRARVSQARTLPDPMVAVGWMGDPAPFRVQRGDPSSFRFFEAREEIPYPGKLRLRHREA